MTKPRKIQAVPKDKLRQAGKSRIRVAAWKEAETERLESQSRQRELKTAALISVASMMLNKHGYEGLSLSELAAELGVTKQALYNYTPRKQDLLFQCYKRALDLAEEAYDHADSLGGTGLDRIAHFVRFHLNPKATPFAILDNLGALSDDHRKLISRRAKTLEQRMRGYIRSGIDEGRITQIDPKFAEFWILGSLSWMPKWFDPSGDATADRVADSFLQLIFEGLRPR